MLARPPTFGAVIFTKPSACFAFSSAHGTLSAKLKAPSLVLNIKPVSISFLHFGHIMINSSVSYLCVLYRSSTAPDLSVLPRSPPWSIMSGIPSSFGVRSFFSARLPGTAKSFAPTARCIARRCRYGSVYNCARKSPLSQKNAVRDRLCDQHCVSASG